MGSVKSVYGCLGRPKSLSLPKNGKKIVVFGQNSAGRAGDSYSGVVSALKWSTIMFCEPQNFIRWSGALRPYMNGLKTNNFTKIAKKSLILTWNNINFKCVQTV